MRYLIAGEPDGQRGGDKNATYELALFRSWDSLRLSFGNNNWKYKRLSTGER
jgi:hypothetical protein